ncbi:MAG: hypothetical protein JRI46_06600 [Deltaproteobacteria bacterium]|nr:hypothetical protein [Deltaproteobacteria bacterium]
MKLLPILFGASILSVIHAMMPDHWVPIVMISKTERWSPIETSFITALIAIPHIVSTILIGIIIGIIGYKLSSTHEFVTKIAAPLILILLGIIYLFLGLKNSRQDENKIFTKNHKKFAIIASLGTALFFSPCVAIGVYYFTAGTAGVLGIIAVSAIYLIVTVLGMVLMVNLALRGIEKIKWQFLKHHERGIIGTVLIALGILMYFVEM